MGLEGVWLPIVTPFVNDDVDYASYEKLIDFYIPKGIAGLIPLGTTGESPVISDYEYEGIIEKTIEITNGRVPVYVGTGGNHTQKVLKTLNILSIFIISHNVMIIILPWKNGERLKPSFPCFFKNPILRRSNIVSITWN